MAAASANAICLSQKPAVAGALAINGALAVSGFDRTALPFKPITQALLDVARHVAIASDANDSDRSFTVVGVDRGGRPLTETVAGPNAGSVSTVNNFLIVTGISVDAATAGNITVGTSNAAETGWWPIDIYADIFRMGYEAKLSAGASMTLQWQMTLGDVQDLNLREGDHLASNIGVPANASNSGVHETPCKAMRVKITAYASGTLETTLILE